MILHISYRKARVWEGRAPQQIDLDEYEPSEGDG